MPDNSTEHRKTCDIDAAPTLPPLPHGIEIGGAVQVRGRHWRVDALVDRIDCRELHLCDSGGDRRVLLWPFDRPSAQAQTRRVRIVTLPAWMSRAQARLARRRSVVTPRGSFHGDLLPYQLAPAAAVRAGVARVLLADEVGLGKTVQAGWIAADLLAREPDARVLIAVPASLREQWIAELRALFSIAAEPVDAAWLRAAVAGRPADVSPWMAPGAYVGSIDFLKRPDVARSLDDVCWDLLVVDEAHAATAPTERHAAIARVAAGSRRLVIITATPYSGDPASLASMLALGSVEDDPAPLMFRRSRDEAGDRRTRRHHFATVRITRAGFRLQRLLERYTRDVWRAAGDADGARLAMTILRKRALSSAAAAHRSLARRLELLRTRPPSERQLSLFEDESEDDDTLPEAALAAPGLADADLERRWLVTLVEAAARAMDADSKQRYLLRLIARAHGESIIVFTEYRDTLRRLAEVLPAALHLHGGLGAAERIDVQRRFNERGGILLATDAAADGLNLQHRCRLLVNYELPWNPARLEQRIGRVDRIGQRRAVHAVSLVARDTAEDLVVASLARRLARVAATLGDRDRLAAFLSDAKTARGVIGGVPIDFDEQGPVAPAVPRARTGEYPVGDAARELATSATIPVFDEALSIAMVPCRDSLPPGFVVLATASAVTDQGAVAERALLLQTDRADTARPRSRFDARRTAMSVARGIESAPDRLPTMNAWFEQVAAEHRSAVTRRIAREQALARQGRRRDEIQPGLFDGRALRQMEEAGGAMERRRLEHARMVGRLTALLEVRLECRVTGVLIVWR